METNQEEIEIEIEHALLEKLQALASKENLPVGQYINMVMKQYLHSQHLISNEGGK